VSAQAIESVWTERKMLDLLRARHSQMVGNGPVWGYMEHVRDGAGFTVQTTIDALAIHMWPSKHHAMHAFEVKVSRGDWLRELSNPDRAGAWTAIVDYFWVAAPSGVVKVAQIRWRLAPARLPDPSAGPSRPRGAEVTVTWLHVMPRNDNRPHVFVNCPCNPLPELCSGGGTVTHHAFDKRELRQEKAMSA
jgi:hypothetical protein